MYSNIKQSFLTQFYSICKSFDETSGELFSSTFQTGDVASLVTFMYNVIRSLPKPKTKDY